MMDALIAGKVYGQPQSRNDAKGNPYCFGKVRARALLQIVGGDKLIIPFC